MGGKRRQPRNGDAPKTVTAKVSEEIAPVRAVPVQVSHSNTPVREITAKSATTIRSVFRVPVEVKTTAVRFPTVEQLAGSTLSRQEKLARGLDTGASAAGVALRKSLAPLAGMQKELATMRASRLLGVSDAMQSIAAQTTKFTSTAGHDLVLKDLERTRALIDTSPVRAMQEATRKFQTDYQPLVSNEAMKTIEKMQRDLASPALKALQEEMARSTAMQMPWSKELREQLEQLRTSSDFTALRELHKQLDSTAFQPARLFSPPEMQERLAAIDARTVSAFTGLKTPSVEALLGRIDGKLLPNSFRELAMRIEKLVDPDLQALISAGFQAPVVRAAAAVAAVAIVPFEMPSAADDGDSVGALVVRLQKSLYATQDQLAEATDLTPKELKQAQWILQFLVAYLLAKLIDYLVLFSG